jgi:hypothetical protein
MNTGAGTPTWETPAHRLAGQSGPGEQLRGRLVHPVTGTDIDHAAPAVREPYEVVRSVTAHALPLASVQPERLRRDPDHLRIPVHQDQTVPLHPRLLRLDKLH